MKKVVVALVFAFSIISACTRKTQHHFFLSFEAARDGNFEIIPLLMKPEGLGILATKTRRLIK